jgi:hypothetical protein
VSRHLRVTMHLDDAGAPEIGEPHTQGVDRAFLFVTIDNGLDLWAHSPAAFRRLADALVLAADRLEDGERERLARQQPNELTS